MDLPDHVHALPLSIERDGRELTFHPSAVETDRGLLLLDAGMPFTVGALADRLDEAGFALADVATLLVTHQDLDHVGGASAVVDHSDALVVAHETDAPVIDGREAPRVPGGGDGDGEDAGDDEGDGVDRAPPVPVDVELGGPATIRTRAGPARVVPTPGHTPGHVSVYLPESGTLLAADALTAQGGELHGPRPDVTEDVETGLASVARLADLDVERVLCYHGGLVAADAGRLAEIAGED